MTARSLFLSLEILLLLGVSGCAWGPFRSPEHNPYTAEAPLFVRVDQSGLPSEGATWGGTFADLDDDGLLDLVFSRHAGEIHAYRNLGGLAFERIDSGWVKPEGLKDPHALSAYDYDHDGDTDFYITVGAKKGRGIGNNQLWVCEEPGVYRDLAAEQTVLQDARGSGRGVSWFDLNADDRPELMVANFKSPSAVFGEGPEGWEDWTDRVHPPPLMTRFPGWWLMSIGDLDLDGRSDLVASRQDQLLYRNDGAGQLVDVSDSVGIAFPQYSCTGVPLGDIDGDGDLDILSSFRTSPWLVVWTNELEEASWSFRPSYPAEELDLDGLVFGCRVADLDNDGRLDLYLLRAAGGGLDAPDVLARGRGDGTFENVTAGWGGADSTRTLPHSVWPIDLDQDGDLDLVCFQLGSSRPGNQDAIVLYENRSRGKGVTLRLRSVGGLAEGLGSLVEIRGDGAWRRQEVRMVGDPYSSMVAPVHFGGLSEHSELEVRVHWRSGEIERFTLPGAGAAYVLKQGQGRPDPENTPEVARR